jgi:AAA+ superfamily predicted ATPase
MTTENHRERHTLNDLTDAEISVVENFEREVAEAKLEKYTPNNGYNQWAIHPGGKFSPTMPTKKKIDPGFYEVGNDSNVGFYLQKKKITIDELYHLPSDELQDMIEDIEKFWNRKEKYKEYNYVHKRGILLYGDPGNGKSGIIQLCTKYLIEDMNGIVINLSNGDQIDYYQHLIGPLREIEPDTPLIVILEDIDSIAGEGSWSTSMLLNLLDGIKQIDNVVYLATTNYPEKLEERITNRPSRFDRRYEIEMPSDKVREAYIKNKLTPEEILSINLEEWIEKTNGLSLAHMRELIISVCAMGNTFEDTMDRLNGLKIKPKIKSKNKEVGFKK